MKTIITTLVMGFLYLLILGLTGQEVWLNDFLSRALQLFQVPAIVKVMNFLRFLGSFECMLVFTVLLTIYLYMKKRETTLTYFLIDIMIVGSIFLFLRGYYALGRPELFRAIPIAGIGYLSVELFGVTAFYLTVREILKKEPFGFMVSVLSIVVIVLIALANLLTKASYFSDLLFGYLLGLLFYLCFKIIYMRHVTKLSLQKDRENDNSVV